MLFRSGLPPTQTVILAGSTGVQAAAPQGYVETNTTTDQVAGALGTYEQVNTMIASAVGGPAGAAIAQGVASVVNTIAGIFTGAHRAAVAKEQSINCAVAYAFNKYIPQYDYAVASGQMTAEAALAAVTQLIQSQLLPELQEVTSAHNWGWSAGQVLQAHLYFRQQWYPMLESNPLASVGGSVVGSLTSNPVLLVVAAVAAIALLGRKKA